MVVKYCYACKQNKLLDTFGKNRAKKDGLADECKECKSKLDKKYHAENRDEHCAKMKEWRNDNLEQCQKNSREYARSKIGRENNNRACRKYYKNHREECLTRTKKRNAENPEKYRAEYQVRNAVKLGKLTRPSHCQKCNRKGSVDAHHPDYSKPFEVDWLCEKCHGFVHRKGD